MQLVSGSRAPSKGGDFGGVTAGGVDLGRMSSERAYVLRTKMQNGGCDGARRTKDDGLAGVSLLQEVE